MHEVQNAWSTYNAQNRKLGDAGDYLGCLFVFTSPEFVYWSYHHLPGCSILYKSWQHWSIQVLHEYSELCAVSLMVKMVLCRVALKPTIILGCSAFGHGGSLKRGCWWSTIRKCKSSIFDFPIMVLQNALLTQSKL